MLQAVEVPVSTLIVLGSHHTVHYISADQLHAVSPSSTTSHCSSQLSTSSSESHGGGGVDVCVLQSADADITDARCGLSDHENNERAVADLSDLDDLREVDLLPLPPLCSSSSSESCESPFYLDLSDDELRRIITADADCGTPVDELVSAAAAELSWPSPGADASPPAKPDPVVAGLDYCTPPEVIELLGGSVYDDWLRHDPDTASLFSPPFT